MEEKVDCQDETNPQASETEVMPVLSKNQMKKQIRIQRWAETKKERRKKEREKTKERKKRILEEARKEGIDEESLATKKKRMSDPEASNIRVAIDCSYDSLMTEPDIKKLLKQIQRCYAENRKSNKPLQLYISSLNDKTKRLMHNLIQGYQNWDVHLEEEEPEAAFGADNMVYLAAESPNVLQDLDPSKVYIIGGLVDHNHHKGYCYERVVKEGWTHAQLPISDFVKLNSRKVLAVNHVYEIILAYIQCGNWKDAFFQVLPNRKVRQFLSEDDPAQDSSKSPSGLTEAYIQEEEQSTSEQNSAVAAARKEEDDLVVARTDKEEFNSDVGGENEKDLQQDDVNTVANISDTPSENFGDQSEAKECHAETVDNGTKPKTLRGDGCDDKDLHAS